MTYTQMLKFVCLVIQLRFFLAQKWTVPGKGWKAGMLGSREATLPAYQHSSILAFKQYANLEPGLAIVDRFTIRLKHVGKN